MAKNKSLTGEGSDSQSSKKEKFSVLDINGAKYKTLLTKKYENRNKWVKHNPKNIVSVIPGTIDDIYVREGDKVKKGGRMIKFEAMKMLNTIEVPFDGKIKKINIKKGDRIPKGFLMLEFE